jgi:DNA (cytosine-5)-methyltransferase 1
MGRFYEFFAGGGMARAGFGEKWECLLANDIDAKKGTSYAANWGSGHLRIEDVSDLTAADLPGQADLAWASFPCQDLSLAGAGAGLRGERSGAFWPFWQLIKALVADRRAPPIIVIENVCGALTSHGGTDFAAIGDALTGSGYRFGALVIDAVRFVPQSRPRLFIVGVDEGRAVPQWLTTLLPDPVLHPNSLVSAYQKLSQKAKKGYVWWRLPETPTRESTLSDLVEDDPTGVAWHTSEETLRLLSMMSPTNRRKVEEAKLAGRRMVGGIYRRTRKDKNGDRAQRAEVRFDDVAGCLRTPAGGSSRQSIMIVDGETVHTRLLSSREAARLMGLPDSYKLPENYNDAYHLAGDGVVVPVVRFLAAHILEPLLIAEQGLTREAA